METNKRNKTIGIAMMAVSSLIVLGIILTTKVWLWLLIGLLCGAAFYAGLKLYKGETAKEIIEGIKDKLDKEE